MNTNSDCGNGGEGPTATQVVDEPDRTSIGIRTVQELLQTVAVEGRTQLFEHEAYRMIEALGPLRPPVHVFVPYGEVLDRAKLVRFPKDRVVLKLVSQDVVHKSDIGGVVFVQNEFDAVSGAIEALYRRHAPSVARIAGVLIVEFVDYAALGFGRELFVGIRATREFGPVIAAGLGGVNTEYLASKLRQDVGVAKALAMHATGETFLKLFRQTAAYDLIAGQARGHVRIVSDAELCRCFDVFIRLARAFCRPREFGQPQLLEFEVNPFTFRSQSLVPLDGRGRLGLMPAPARTRSTERIDALLVPRTMALIGVSSRRENFARIILRNTLRCGFPRDQITIIKEGEREIDGVRCVSRLSDLEGGVDLLVLAAAGSPAEYVRQILVAKNVQSAILIPAGMGETENTEELPGELRGVIDGAAAGDDDRTVFLGGNCLGIRSRPGRYDTFFLPEDRLDPMLDLPVARAALVAQSGGFIISRLSNWKYLNPALAISIGNQLDVTVSDLLNSINRRNDIDVVGVYMEGFRTLDGDAFIRAIGRAVALGKRVVFYKAGRTPAGRSAMEGHTASIAGDYDVCRSAVEQAGAIVTETFKEFEQVMELSVRLHGRRVCGRRLAAISNAGFEAVGMADAINGPHYQVEMAPISEKGVRRLREALRGSSLASLVNVNNPLDLTPMADDEAYETCLRILLEDEQVDGVVASLVPMVSTVKAMPDELDDPDSIVARLIRVFRETTKPMAVVVDCDEPFNELKQRLRAAGIPVIPSSDQAVRSMGRYLCHGVELNRNEGDPSRDGLSV